MRQRRKFFDWNQSVAVLGRLNKNVTWDAVCKSKMDRRTELDLICILRRDLVEESHHEVRRVFVVPSKIRVLC